MKEKIEELEKQVADLTKTVTDLRVKLAEEFARKDGGQRATVWWASGVALLIAVWLGATSFWQIPHTIQDKVNASASGQAATAAQKALDDITTFRQKAEEQFNKINNNAEAAAKSLGIPELQRELKTKVSFGQALHLKSAIQDQYLDVSAGRPGNSTDIAKPNASAAQDWTIVPK